MKFNASFSGSGGFSALLAFLTLSVSVVGAAPWFKADNPSDKQLRAVRFLDGRWFAVGQTGTLLASADGIVWNKVSLGSAVNFTDITFGRNKFVLVSGGSLYTYQESSPLPARWISSDAQTWTPIIADTALKGWGSPFPDNKLSIDRIVFTSGHFVALAAPRMLGHHIGEPRTVLVSLDGENWSSSQSVGLNLKRGEPIFDILEDSNITVIAGADLLAKTNDGVSWTEDDYVSDPWHHPSPLQDQLLHAYGYRVLGRVSGRIIALGFNIRAESADGVHWSKTVLSSDIIPLAFHDGYFYGKADNPADTRLFHSADGRTWSVASDGPEAAIDALAFSDEIVVAIAGNQIFWTNTADLRPVSHAKLLALSFRGRAGSGEDVIISGLAVGGDGPLKVLIRGVGPTLSKQGVRDPLLNPKLILFNGHGEEIGSNDNWGQTANPEAVRSAAAKVGAFPLVDGSNDAALLVTLAPGIYTVHVASVDGSSGVALGEIYQVP